MKRKGEGKYGEQDDPGVLGEKIMYPSAEV